MPFLCKTNKLLTVIPPVSFMNFISICHSRANHSQVKEIADMLIKHNVDIEAQDSRGLTALHYAAFNKCDILVQTIIRAAGNRRGSMNI